MWHPGNGRRWDHMFSGAQLCRDWRRWPPRSFHCGSRNWYAVPFLFPRQAKHVWQLQQDPKCLAMSSRFLLVRMYSWGLHLFIFALLGLTNKGEGRQSQAYSRCFLSDSVTEKCKGNLLLSFKHPSMTLRGPLSQLTMELRDVPPRSYSRLY